MAYQQYISGSVRIYPALDDASLAELNAWLAQESTTEALRGLTLAPDAMFFDNDAPWRPGMDEGFDPRKFAEALEELTLLIQRAGSLSSGEFSITSESYENSDFLRTVAIDGYGAILDGERVSQRAIDLDLDSISP
jgi:hypothetical protein